MSGGGGRQLPSWMTKSTATEPASSSERKGETKENGVVEPHSKSVESLKIVEAKKHDTGGLLAEDNIKLLKKCEARTRKRKSNKHEEGLGETLQEGGSCLLKPCKGSRSKGMPALHVEDQADDFFENDTEKKADGVVKKRVRRNAPRKKHSKESTKELHNGTAKSGPREDDLTVEDLVSIAEEYLKADREKDYEKSNNMEFEPEAKPLFRADFEIGSEKNLTSHAEKRLVTDMPLASNSSLTKPITGEGSYSKLDTTGDPAQDMLDLLLGRRLKNYEKAGRKVDAMTEKITLDHELTERSQNETLAEVAPVVKKKFSLKDAVGRLLD